MAATMSNYTIIVKYPGDYDEITQQEYEDAVKIAETFLFWVEERIAVSDKLFLK